MNTALTSALQDLAGPDAAVAVEIASSPTLPLWPIELSAIERAVPQRRAEFTAGRAAARRAMAALGLRHTAIPMGPDRAPVWPVGVVGSISHTNGTCIAVAGKTTLFSAIGVDLEQDDPLDADLWPQICTVAELGFLANQPLTMRGQTAKLIFSAKECAYKRAYPQLGRILDFQDLQISLDQTGQRFSARFRHDLVPQPQLVMSDGSYEFVGGFVVTIMVQRQF